MPHAIFQSFFFPLCMPLGVEIAKEILFLPNIHCPTARPFQMSIVLFSIFANIYGREQTNVSSPSSKILLNRIETGLVST